MSIPIPPAAASEKKKKDTAAKNKKSGNTPSAQALADAAELLAKGGYNVTSSGATGVTGISRGNDPVTGKPIVSTVVTSAQGESWFKNLPPAERKALQRKMSATGLYPQGYRPSEFVTKEDLAAVDKLVYVGDQRGIADLNKVLDLASKDKEVRTFLQTGGYAQGGTVSVTDATQAKLTLNNYFLDLFNDKPTNEEIKAYQTALNSRERATKGALGAPERNDIILAIANKRIKTTASKAAAGDTLAKEALDTGQLGRRVRELRNYYNDNGIPVDDKVIYRKAGDSLRSQDAYDNIVEDLSQSARLQWGKLAENLKPGQTMRDKLQPYITARATIRGVNEEDIKVSEMTDVMNPDGTFKNFSQYEEMQYKSKEYLTGQTFKNIVRNDTKTLLENFGIK